MAWFSSIAGKAEQLLNQLDEAAATSLRDSGMTTPNKSQTTPTTSDSFQSEPVAKTGLSYEPVAQSPPAYSSRQQQHGAPPLKSTVSSSNVAPPTWDSPWGVPFSSSSPKVSRSSTGDGRGQQAKEDDSLLDFLNSPSSGSGKKKTTPTSTGSEKRAKIKKSKVTATTTNITGESTDSALLGLHDKVISLDSAKTDPVSFSDLTNKPPLQIKPISTPPIISYQPSQKQEQQLAQSKTQQTEEGAKPVEPVEGGLFTVTQKQLEEENMRLREEISYLSAELRNNKIKNDERGKVESQLKIDVSSLKKQVSQLEQLLQRMRSQEDDLKSTLESRESQIQVLRTRLLESDEKLKMMKEKMEETERAKDQFLSDVGKSSDAQNQAILSVKSQLEQSQHQLLQERENQTRLKEEFEEREFSWNKEREEMSQTLYMQGKELQMQQLKYSECHNNLQSVKQELQLLHKEHSEYKVKAAGILQAKEKVIDSLKSSSEGGGGERGLEAALDEMRSEKYQLQSQLINNEQVILSLRTELQEIEDSRSLEVDELRQQVTLSEETLETERQAHLTTQDELSSLQKELDSLKDELVKEKATFVGQMREREKMIEDLKSQVKSSSSQPDSSRQQLEERLKELTESLIEKQTNLEELTAEYNSTQLQLKRAETAATEAQAKIKAAANRPSHTVLNIESDSTGSGSSLQPMASMLPESDSLRPRHLRRVRNTLDSVDKIGLRVAWVLRRYPCVRLLTIGYILLLHLWVMIVLFTYQPEIHQE
ncbi:PREDICTED: golgin subfamily A member 5-like [Amphimedon queenslandica]|uniref:Uncharacterized protein n=1 Tax=Amphimedon queenslandica TaxID=400682 RepID=A0A1X7UNB1_AMPQE|nr:PREDICTED: golgin subfamily A member 5-like [Amphimedon queenslandica]|eukprot:XP_019853266.1 PREDICTED: golgin subfamily A member 5-like [Amphimedon queenslandica]